MTNQFIVKICALLFAGVLAVIAIVLTYGDYEVIEKGQLLEYSRGMIYHIRLFGELDLYVEPEVRPTDDVLVSIVLFGIGFIAVTFAFLEYGNRRRDEERVFLFFVVLATGAFYLASDELFGIHESLGHNLPFLGRIPGVRRPDDVIIALYGIPALFFVVYFRRLLLNARGSFPYFLAAVVLFFLAAASDIFTLGKVEEILEVLSVFAILYGTLSFGRSVLLNIDPKDSPN